MSFYVIKHILTLVYVVKLSYLCSDVIDIQCVLPIYLNNRHYIYKRLIFKNYCFMDQKKSVYRVFPVDSDGVCVKGVIPIVCLDDDLCDAYEMLEDEILSKHLSFNSFKVVLL